jgi:primosomal protein N' (replication factor Y)
MPDPHVLRRDATDAERRLWAALRARRLASKFRRQHPIGRYVVDLACIEARLVVEADGGQHADSAWDVVRTRYLERGGWRVIRFWNNDILGNTEGVLLTIMAALDGTASPSPGSLRSPPSPALRARESQSLSPAAPERES